MHGPYSMYVGTPLNPKYMGDCQNYGPFLGPYYNTGPSLGDPKRDHNFDNPPYIICLHGPFGEYDQEVPVWIPGDLCYLSRISSLGAWN